MGTIILIAVLGAIISAITGTLWYSGSTPMGKWHMEYLGFNNLTDEEKKRLMAEAKPKMFKLYSAQMLLSLLTSLFIGFTASYTVQNGGAVSAVYYYVLMAWAAFTLPQIGQGLLWGKVEKGLAWKKFFSDNLYNLITFLIIAWVATLLI